MLRFLPIAVLTCGLVAGGADARTVGHRDGARTDIEMTRVGDVRLEVRTARAYRAMERAADTAHVRLAIRSGYRSYAQQAALYARYRRGQGNLAAPAGSSHHELGRALDLVVKDARVRDWLGRHAATYGFHRTVPGEAWHYEYLVGTETVSLASPRAHRKRAKRPTAER